jgi:hypothetical protein
MDYAACSAFSFSAAAATACNSSARSYAAKLLSPLRGNDALQFSNNVVLELFTSQADLFCGPLEFTSLENLRGVIGNGVANWMV